MKKLYVFDIDRTIKPFIGAIPKSTKEAIMALNQRHFVCLATGRQYHETQAVAKALGIRFLVCSGGSQVYIDGKCVVDKTPVMNEELRQLNMQKPVHLVVSKQGVYSSHFPLCFKLPSLFRFFGSEQSSPKHLLNTIHQVKRQSLPSNLAVHKIFVFSSTYKSSLDYHHFNTWIHSWEYRDKSFGIKQLCLLLGDIEEVIAFGDSYNDIELFKYANRQYAITPGNKILQQNCTKVIPFKGGIANVLKNE